MVIHVIKAGVVRYREVEVVPRGERGDSAGFDGRDFIFAQVVDGLPDFLKLSLQSGEFLDVGLDGLLHDPGCRAFGSAAGAAVGWFIGQLSDEPDDDPQPEGEHGHEQMKDR